MIKTEAGYLYSEKTDTGKVREINEDSFGNLKTDKGHYFFVCDGMGGHEGGEVASSMAVELIKKYITKLENEIPDICKLFESVLFSVNKEIYEYSVRNNKIKGMGTTCVLLYLNKNLAYYANVGDSRIYLSHDNAFTRLTKDQSLVQELVNQNIITPEEAENHPRKNEILQALGFSENLSPAVGKTPVTLSKGDKLLLCTDGLSSYIKEDQILSAINNDGIESSCNKLIDAANNAGGKDNITVQLIEFTGEPE